MARLKPHEAVVHLQSRFTGEQRRRELVLLAHEAIAEASAINNAATGQDVGYETIVDGRRHAPVESVKPGGIIVALFAVQSGAIDFTYETLLRLSPVETGRYRSSHVMLVNGAEAGPPPLAVEPDDVIVFVNTAPYARRLEKGWSSEAPDGVYEAASEIVRARYGNIVQVRFNYRHFSGLAVAANQGRKHGDAALPSIELSPKRGGAR